MVPLDGKDLQVSALPPRKRTLAVAACIVFGFSTALTIWNSVANGSKILRLSGGLCWKGDNLTAVLSKVEGLRTSYALTELFEGPGLKHVDVETRAACKFVPDDHTPHFPHAMQQLYRCFSWWRANPTKEPYLIMNSKHALSSAFMKGMIERFRDTFGLRVVHMRSDLKVVRPIISYAWDEQNSFAMRSSHDANALRHGILKQHGVDSNHQSCFDKPRVRIVNRLKNRSIQNIKGLVRAIEGLGAKIDGVRVNTFEEKPFREQVAFLSEADILISPHGAALTGIPLMPDCSGVLELFPAGYLVPAFFGSLAAVSGVSHNYMYLGHNHKKELQVGMKTFETREYARKANVCPDEDQIVDAIKRMINERDACCHREVEKSVTEQATEPIANR
jgi:hypothetical protein